MSGRGRCEERLYDQHFVVGGRVARLGNDYIDIITSDPGTFISRHNRWAELEAREILVDSGSRRAGVRPRLGGTAIERKRFLRTQVYGSFPLFVHPFLLWFYSYVVRPGFLDGVQGLIFSRLQRFWFRFLIESKLSELKRRGSSG